MVTDMNLFRISDFDIRILSEQAFSFKHDLALKNRLMDYRSIRPSILTGLSIDHYDIGYDLQSMFRRRSI